MLMVRNEFPEQGVMWAGRNICLYPPEYIFKYGPPRGDVPVGAWEVKSFSSSYEAERFATKEEALKYLAQLLGQKVQLEGDKS